MAATRRSRKQATEVVTESKAPEGFTLSPDNRHPLYTAWSPEWIEARDALDGQVTIKAKGEVYLPRPSGMAASPNAEAAYNAYRMRAQVPELMSLTVRGLAGVIHRKPSEYAVPGGLEDSVARITVDRLSLEAFHRRVTREVLTTGRYGILVDAPRGGGAPYMCGYRAEQIVDWSVNAEGKTDLVVLDETGPARQPNGVWADVNQFRVLRLVDNRYQQTLWQLSAGGAVSMTDQPIEPADKSKAVLEEIPFVFVGTMELGPDPDDIPLIQVARSQLAIYRLDADYRHSLFLTAQPTPVISGVDDDKIPRFLGSSVAWILPAGAEADLLEFTGAGADAMRTAIKDEYDRAVMAGARMFEENTEGQESGVSRKLRYSGQNATLTTVAKTAGEGLQRALQFIAVMVKADPEACAVTPNTDFVEANLASSDITALIDSWLKGAISKPTLFYNLQRGGVVPEGRDFDEEEGLIEEFLPDLGGGDEPPPDDEPDEPDEPPLEPEVD